MKDTPQEIASIFNLILPSDNQFSTGNKFLNEFVYIAINQSFLFTIRCTIPSIYPQLYGRLAMYLSSIKLVT